MKNFTSKKLFAGTIDISYSHFCIECEDPDNLNASGEPFLNQKNGLLGAAVQESLLFIATNNSTIQLEIQLYSEKPDIENDYTEIVEASFNRGFEPVLLCQWAHEEEFPLDIPIGTYRVRYNIDGLDKDYDDDCSEDDYSKPIKGQRYLIQIWPDSLVSDDIIKQTSDVATYWHESRSK